MQIDPHENEANKKPLSLMLKAVGADKPVVSNLTGTTLSSRLSTLNKPVEVEK